MLLKMQVLHNSGVNGQKKKDLAIIVDDISIRTLLFGCSMLP